MHDYLKKSTDHGQLTYAYFKHDSTQLQSLTNIIASFIKQLCHNMDIPSSLLNFHYEFDRNQQVPSLKRFISEFQCLARRSREVFILIYALDESNKADWEIMIEFLVDSMRAIPCLKVFVTTRKEHDIETQFRRIQVPMIPIEAEAVKEDIETFVRGRVQECIDLEKLCIKSSSLKDRVIHTLTNEAQGM